MSQLQRKRLKTFCEVCCCLGDIILIVVVSANPKLKAGDLPSCLWNPYCIVKGKTAEKAEKAASVPAPKPAVEEKAKKRKVKGKGRAEEAQKKPQRRYIFISFQIFAAANRSIEQPVDLIMIVKRR